MALHVWYYRELPVPAGEIFKILICERNNFSIGDTTFIDFSHGYTGSWTIENLWAKYHENKSDENHEYDEDNSNTFFRGFWLCQYDELYILI